MKPKDRVLRIIKNELNNAEDNLYRANMQFVKMSDDLTLKYGQSGRTYGEILEQYQTEVSELKECIAWLDGSDW